MIDKVAKSVKTNAPNQSNPTKSNNNSQKNSNNLETIKAKLVQNMNKEQMAELIMKQNNVLSHQSNQIINIIDLADNVEKKCKVEAAKCQLVKAKNNICKRANEIKHQQLSIYERSMKIQIILFILFLLVLVWLLRITLFADSAST